MDINLYQCFIAVDDHDKALRFYRDVLDFEVRKDVEFHGMRWVTVGAPSHTGVEIVLQESRVSPNTPPSEKGAMAQLLANGLLSGATFRIDDVNAAFERICASGAEVLQEPIDQPYGVRDCAFRDPSGNMVRFSQPRR